MDNNSLKIQVKIYAPFKTYFDGQADSFSAANNTGPFDILAHHKNFMSLLKTGPVTIRQQGKPDFKMNVDRGVMHVRNDKVTVFLDI